MNDKRRDTRLDCFLKAEILLAGGEERVPCEAHDISTRGLKLSGPDLGNIPDSFMLTIPRRGITERVNVIRRSPEELGVQFDSFKF